MHPRRTHMVLFLVSSGLVVVAAEQLMPIVDVQLTDSGTNKKHVHVANGLSNAILFTRCQSKNTDIGEHNLDLGASIQWHFFPNLWGTTLFWCFMRKQDVSASFEVYWNERHSNWLGHRCSAEYSSCVWIAKDDGVYIRNLTDNVDELIHKWT